MDLNEQIALWTLRGKQLGRAYLLVVQDGDLHFPSFVRIGDSLPSAKARLNGKPHTLVVKTIEL